MHRISSDSDDTRSFIELKNKMSAEAKEQVEAKVEVMMAELDHLDASEVEVAETKCIAQESPVQGSRSMPDHTLLHAQTPELNIPSTSLLREDRDKR